MDEKKINGGPEKPVDISEITEAKVVAAVRKRFPTWLDLLVVIGIFFAASIVIGMIVAVANLFGAKWDQGAQQAFSYGASMLLTLGGVALWRRMRGERGRIVEYSLRGFNPLMLLWGIALVFISGIVIEPLLELFPDSLMQMLNNLIGRGGWAIFTTVVMAPVLEEFIFRGYIFGSVKRKSGTVAAIFTSAAMFGIIHIIPQQVVNAFVVGVILGYIYVRTESIFSVIIIHAVNNAVSYVLMGLSDDPTLTLREMLGNDTLYYIVYGVSAALFVISFYMVGRSLKEGDPAEENDGR